MTIRPPWRKLWQKRSQVTDFSVSPVHEIEDDVEPPPTDTGGGGTPVAEVLVTGVTSEYPTSEIIYTEEGDIVSAVTT